MELTAENGALLLLVAAVVAMLTRRLRLPYSVGLVAAGIVLAISPVAPKVDLTEGLIFTVLLPPLLFEAALYIHWNQLRRDLPVIVLLATAGVLISAWVTATGMRYMVDWPWTESSLFGVLIAATDPVSVVATFKEAQARGRLLVLIEAESLLNDGTAAVAFGVTIWRWRRGNRSRRPNYVMLFRVIGGGILCGAAVALTAMFLDRTNRRSSRRNYIYNDRRVWFLPPCDSLWRVRCAGDNHRGAGDGQFRTVRQDLRPR